MTQTLLSAAQIRGAVDLDHEDVEVPEWGGTIRLKQMAAGENQKFTEALMSQKGTKDGMYLMLIFSARDLEDNFLFPHATPEQIEEHKAMLQEKSIEVLNRLQLIALRLNKTDVVGREALKKD